MHYGKCQPLRLAKIRIKLTLSNVQNNMFFKRNTVQQDVFASHLRLLQLEPELDNASAQHVLFLKKTREKRKEEKNYLYLPHQQMQLDVQVFASPRDYWTA